MDKIYLLLIGVLLSISVSAQTSSGMRGSGGARLNAGHMYGKVIDSKTNKGLGGATVQIIGSRYDSATGKMKDAIFGTVISSGNGDFSLEKLPAMGKKKLRISSVGYKDYDSEVSFDIKMPARGSGGTKSSDDGSSGSGTDQMSNVLGAMDKDLGNIKLEAVEATLETVTVTASAKPLFEMGIDRKIFNVDKDLVSSGQSATEVMKQIPSLNVDIDGNVTMRNSTPTLFVDGRPTTLTLDQIPSDIIDKVELITNPSAKFDASGGNAGILNIVLKKNKKSGYYGGVRLGIDSYGQPNFGGDLSYRQGKFNINLSGNYRQRESKPTSTVDRNISLDTPYTIRQTSDGKNTGSFTMLRGGVDYLADNRNTFSVTGSYVHGTNDNNQPQYIDSSLRGINYSKSNVASLSNNSFTSYQGQFSYKHLFAKPGHELSADVNYNSATSNANSNTVTSTTRPLVTYPDLKQLSNTEGYNRFFTVQSDYEHKITENIKLEAGVRAAIRDFKNTNNQYQWDYTTNDYIPVASASSNYKYNDQVYAAYTTYSSSFGSKWNYQAGLRVESSNYTGTLIGGGAKGQDTTFKVDYPLSLFPSLFLTYKVNDNSDIQFNYSRRVSRPSFFQLSPTLDISDRMNPQRGNPNLGPSFTNSLEASYSKRYKGGNFLATGYVKYATDLITSYIVREPNNLPPSIIAGDSIDVSTFINANNSWTYGLELTNKLTMLKIWDLTLNVNLYNSIINSTIQDVDLSNQRVSWFAKMNNSFKLPLGFSVQFSGQYQAKTVLPQGGDGRRGGGGPGFGPPAGTTQGYINPRYGFDLAVKKDWKLKGGNTASLSLSMNDIFRTQEYSTYSQSSSYTQTQVRTRDPQMLRVNFSYRFGKFDASLFKRKSTKSQGDSDSMGTDQYQ